MKKILIVLLVLASKNVFSQLTIGPGGQLTLTGNAQLTLLNEDMINNGSFTAGTATVTFNGNSSTFIGGTQPTLFYNLEINKTTASTLQLQRLVSVTNQVNFIIGGLDLNGFDLNLGSSGILNGEKENSRVLANGGGRVIALATLNAPVAANPGNLGAIISSSVNLGAVTIKRGHLSQVNSGGAGNSILRYYDIDPANNSSLNATLRFMYFDGELNGLDENTLTFFRSSDNTTWKDMGFNSRNTVANFVEKTGISAFSRWTLSSIGNPLPVHFLLFNTNCKGEKTLLTWRTAQEVNSERYDIEKSVDGLNWQVIGSVRASNNGAGQANYSFTDDHPGASTFYRVAERDISGRAQYTEVAKVNCGRKNLFETWPNPVTRNLNISIGMDVNVSARVELYDSKGSLIKTQASELLPGNNLLVVDMAGLVNGTYLVVVKWKEGQRTVRVVKH
jgi:hypothetical protein